MPLHLPDDEKLALMTLLMRTTPRELYRLSPRVRALKDILTKLRQEPVGEPLPPPKVRAPARATAARRQRQEM
jgi:hypothetical protein